jgi:hypothetical protein
MSKTDEAASENALQAAVGRSLEQAVNDFDKPRKGDNPEETTAKLFGLFEMDKSIVNLITGFYTAMIGEFNNFLSPKTYKTIQTYAPKLFKPGGKPLEGAALNRLSAGGAMAVNAGVILLPAIGQLISDVRNHHHLRAQSARELAPVLDDLFGKHSIGTYNSVKKEENSVIWAHRKRISNEASASHSRLVWSALASNAANLLREHLNFRSMLSGKDISTVIIDRHPERGEELTQQYTQEAHARLKKANTKVEMTPEKQAEIATEVRSKVAEKLNKEFAQDGLRLAFFGANFGLPQIIGKIAESSKKRLTQARQPYSAYEAIKHLAEQLENNPGRRDRFQLPKQRGEASLVACLAEVVKVHQREMCDLDPTYSELRPSLNEDLQTLVKPIAEALHAGKLSPIMLVRLVGEGKIVKNHGRGLASPTELATTLEAYVGKTHAINTRDPKEYLSNSNFSLEQLKESLSTLEGEERLHLSAFIPDGVLKAAGFDDKEIKQVQSHRLEHGYQGFLMHAVVGAATHSDEVLKADGLSSAQIKHLRAAAQKLDRDGIKALDAIISSPTNPDGIDSTVLADLAVPKTAVGDRNYVSKLAAEGKKAEAAEGDDGRAADMAHSAINHAKSGKSPAGKHAEREGARRAHDAHAEGHHAAHH